MGPDDNIVWGIDCGDQLLVVGQEHRRLGQNIVWGIAEGLNIVWGNNIVWGRTSCGARAPTPMPRGAVRAPTATPTATRRPRCSAFDPLVWDAENNPELADVPVSTGGSF